MIAVSEKLFIDRGMWGRQHGTNSYPTPPSTNQSLISHWKSLNGVRLFGAEPEFGGGIGYRGLYRNICCIVLRCDVPIVPSMPAMISSNELARRMRLAVESSSNASCSCKSEQIKPTFTFHYHSTHCCNISGLRIPKTKHLFNYFIFLDNWTKHLSWKRSLDGAKAW